MVQVKYRVKAFNYQSVFSLRSTLAMISSQGVYQIKEKKNDGTK